MEAKISHVQSWLATPRGTFNCRDEALQSAFFPSVWDQPCSGWHLEWVHCLGMGLLGSWTEMTGERVPHTLDGPGAGARETPWIWETVVKLNS